MQSRAEPSFAEHDRRTTTHKLRQVLGPVSKPLLRYTFRVLYSKQTPKELKLIPLILTHTPITVVPDHKEPQGTRCPVYHMPKGFDGA